MDSISGIYSHKDALIHHQFGQTTHDQTESIKGTQCQLLLKPNQSMWDILNRYCIIYQGQVSNYLELQNELKNLGSIFKTNSPAEVILNSFATWGTTSLQRFNGSFAFAVLDQLSEEFWLISDPSGTTPLYYSLNNTGIYFSSQKSKLDHSKQAPVQTLSAGHYLHAKLNSEGTLLSTVSCYL